MDIDSYVDLYDSDILAMEAGPIRYAQARQGKMLNIDRFVKDLEEQFAVIGLGVEVQVHTTEQENTWAFKVEIQRRLTPFDVDRMRHEVVNNVLDMPGEEKGHTIDVDASMLEFERDMRDGKHSQGPHHSR
jgi:hypothetical protein